MDWKPGAHASTFGGNPVSVAAALVTMDLLETQYIENARRKSADFSLAAWRTGPRGTASSAMCAAKD